MAYHNNPYTYNFGYPQSWYPQQQQMIDYNLLPTQMSGTSQQSNDYFIWVQGEAGAKSYPVARGTTLPLFDSEGDYVYFKSVDMNGMPQPLIKKVISDPPIEVETKEPEQSQVDLSNYVTKEKYDEFKKKYEALEERVLELETKPIPTISSTFTGNTFNNSRKDGKDDGSKYSV